MRKTILPTVVGLLVLAGCQINDFSTERCTVTDHETMTSAQTLQVPDSFKYGYPFTARVKGSLGPSGCYNFARIDATFDSSASMWTLVPIAGYSSGPCVVCTANIPNFDKTVPLVGFITNGWLKVRVVSKSGFLLDSVYVHLP
jgi:hypothetical protein